MSYADAAQHATRITDAFEWVRTEIVKGDDGWAIRVSDAWTDATIILETPAEVQDFIDTFTESEQ